jgi:hypothetical protein
MCVDLFKVCFSTWAKTFLNMASSFNINNMIFFFNHFPYYFCCLLKVKKG